MAGYLWQFFCFNVLFFGLSVSSSNFKLFKVFNIILNIVIDIIIIIIIIIIVGSKDALENRNKNADILRLVTAYREQGHKNADVDPLNTFKR